MGWHSVAIPHLTDNQRGVALITVVLVALAVSSVAIAASMMTMSGTLVRRYSERTSMASQAALSGVELGLSALLANGALYPTTAYITMPLQDSAEVLDAMGNPIPGVRRSIYIGPSADPSRGSIVSEVWVRGGVRAVRRMEVRTSSFASYGYFVGNDILNSDFREKIFGPAHFNYGITISPPSGPDSATFWGKVTTTGTITNISYGSFRQGHQQLATNTSLPVVDFVSLATMATNADLWFSSSETGYSNSPIRLEFIPVDMDGNPATTDDVEGFVRVYKTSPENRPYVTAQVQGGSVLTTPNCGAWNSGQFESAENGDLDSIAARAAIDNNRYRCYLGGDVTLSDSTFSASDGTGFWVLWGGAPVPGLSAVRPADSGYLHPYTKGVNINSSGVIYVHGDVAVSGVVAGRVTVVALDDIIIVDDLVQYTDPGENACAADLLGLIASNDVVIADNTLNTPQRYLGGSSYHTMDDTKDEYVHAVVMALDDFRVHIDPFNPGPNASDNLPAGAEPCEGAPWGRGCLYLTGGIIQRYRGQIGSTSGTGYFLRHSYNQCVLQGGPPQFPSSGSFSKQRVVEMDGANFNPVTWFANYQS